MSDETVATPTARVETPVTMQDGRVVTFVGKRKLLKETLINEEEGSVAVRLDFLNGETRLFPIPAALLLKAAGHGIEQKLGDETAGVSDVDDMVMGVDELIDRLAVGEWSTQRAASGMTGTSILFKALVEAYPNRTPVELKAYLKGKTQAEKLALRNSTKLKPLVERLEAEKASGSKVDADALLNDLN